MKIEISLRAAINLVILVIGTLHFLFFIGFMYAFFIAVFAHEEIGIGDLAKDYLNLYTVSIIIYWLCTIYTIFWCLVQVSKYKAEKATRPKNYLKVVE
ncbi:MAG: hypothetical protein ACOYMB_03965 [Patescibacteria group bacterium]